MRKVFYYLIFFISFQEVLAQVIFEPSIVFIDPESKTASMKIKNTGVENKEVDISFRFGYSKYDSSGKPYVCYDDSISAIKNSLVPYIRSFPKKLVIGPNSEQVVRFLVRGINDMPDGTYWTRVAASAKDEAKQVDSVSDDKISATISLVVETVNIVFYKKGEANNSLNIDNLAVDEDSVNYILRINCERIGNSPFLGTMSLALYNEDGTLIGNEQKKAAVYFESPCRFRFKKNLLKSGKYKAELTVTNERDDIVGQDRIPFLPLSKSFAFTIP